MQLIGALYALQLNALRKSILSSSIKTKQKISEFNQDLQNSVKKIAIICSKQNSGEKAYQRIHSQLGHDLKKNISKIISGIIKRFFKFLI